MADRGIMRPKNSFEDPSRGSLAPLPGVALAVAGRYFTIPFGPSYTKTRSLGTEGIKAGKESPRKAGPASSTIATERIETQRLHQRIELFEAGPVMA